MSALTAGPQRRVGLVSVRPLLDGGDEVGVIVRAGSNGWVVLPPTPDDENAYVLGWLSEQNKHRTVADAVRAAEVDTCRHCGIEIVEHPDEGNGPWWGQPDPMDFDPCADENGLPAPHTPR